MSKNLAERQELYSAERLNELADSGWLFHFMEKFPRVKQMRAGEEDECLKGAIDMHVHADPCSLAPRSQDYTQVAIDAARAGFRAVVRKDHYFSTIGEAEAIQRHIDHLVETGELTNRIEVFGGVPLAQTLDSAPIERALRLPAFKMIWFNPVGGMRLVEDGRVRPEVERIIKIARDNGLGLNLGQPSHSRAANEGLGDYEGLAPLAAMVAEIGAKAVLDHPLSSFTTEQIVSLMSEKIFAGLFCYPSLPSVAKAPVVDPERTHELVRRLGPGKCLVASDVGMLLEATQLEAMRMMARLLLVLDCSHADLDLMMKINPAILLGLEPGSSTSGERQAEGQ
ncbi:MAG: hypothetical protein IIC64_11340 [SAR324 cluster bacterium]|nr:hypothetical protein [SAR324 cluster bacterium]